VTSNEDRIRAVLPGYEIGGELGRGNWGVVLAGHHRQLERDVALKQLPDALATDLAVRARFESEARILAQLDHPHIVPVYDFVSEDGLCVLVMENLPGGTVWSRFTSVGLVAEDACAIALATSAALHCAHEHGVLHRDIKPDNLMFSGTGTVKVTDFGLAKVIGGSETMATRGGDIIGTPAYMAPEQALGAEPTPATDVYSAGMMLYELLSGVLPFSHVGGSPAVLYRHVHEQPAPLALAAPGIPTTIVDVVMRALVTDPADRYSSANDFGVALATATNTAWGPGWLRRSSVSVMSTGAIEAVTTPAVHAPLPPARSAPTTRVRVVGLPATRRPPGVGAPHEELDLVPVQTLVGRRRRGPVVYALASVALLLLVVAVAFAGPGGGMPTGKTTGGALAVNGVDIPSDAVVRLDLARPIVISGRLAPGSLRRVRLTLSVLEVSLGSVDAPANQSPDGAFSSSLDARGLRYLVTGRVLGTVHLDGDDGPGAVQYFALRVTQPWILTAPGVGIVALALFLIGYAESLLRSLRRGWTSSAIRFVGLVVIGGLAGVVAVAVSWITGGNSPALGPLVVCAVLGAGWGATLALAARRSGAHPQIRAPSDASPV